METVTTRQGRAVILLREEELIDPVEAGNYIRAYCPIHQGENQHSLSVHRETGWGRCFNASCPAFGLPGERSPVLVVEWNTKAATHLCPRLQGELSSLATTAFTTTASPTPRTQKPPPEWQQEELTSLYALYRMGWLRRWARHPWAQAYLEARHIPAHMARTMGVGYLPEASALPFDPWKDKQYRGVGRWCQRIIFPLSWLGGDQILRMGFIGRTLHGWRPGMDENEHKALIDEEDRQAQAQGRRPLRRWRKTNPAGWFGYEPAKFEPYIVVVEGPFDRLALLASGWSPSRVVALSGTAARSGWFPAHVRLIVLALDADAGGTGVTPRLSNHLREAGFQVAHCLPPVDKLGKDWSERWRRAGQAGVQPLYEAVKRHITQADLECPASFSQSRQFL